MYRVSQNYLSKIYESKQALKIYINGIKIEDRYIYGCIVSGNVFSTGELILGSTPCIGIELKLDNRAIPENIESIYIESGLEDELVPLGYFNIDDKLEDDNVTTFTLLDNMIKFEENYNGKELIDEKGGSATLLDVWLDICNKIGVEAGTTSFFNQDTVIAVFDNQISARTYIGYIAEQAGGFACVGRDGKMYIRKIGQDVVEYSKKYLKSGYKFSNPLKISRIKYEDGIQDFVKGDETENTLYISQENMYITSQEQIDEIYNLYNGLELHGFNGSGKIDPALDIGDILIIDNRPVVYQGTMEFSGKFIANISSDIKSKEQEENTSRQISQTVINRRIQSNIDQINLKITQLVEEVVNFLKETTQSNVVHLTDIAKGKEFILNFTVYGNTTYFTSNEITLVASTKNKREKINLLTENENEIHTEISEEILTENETFYIDKINLKLDDILRNYIKDGIVYYDELNIAQDGTITVIRRIGVNEDGTLYLLDKENVVILDEKFVIPSEEDIYYFIEELQNIQYKVQYIIKNNYSDVFATKAEVSASIEMFIEDLVSYINLSADVIKLIGNRFILDSTNCKISEDGTITAKNGIFNGNIIADEGNIGGFNLTKNNFNKEYSMNYEYTMQDALLVLWYLEGMIELDENVKKLLDINDNGTLNLQDVILILNYLKGKKVEYDKLIHGEVIINSNNPNETISITNDLGIPNTRLGIFSMFCHAINCDSLMLGTEYSDSKAYGIFLDAYNRQISLVDSASSTIIKPSEVKSPKITQTSLATEKKNFEKLENASDIIKDIDIYKYNLKFEEDTDKKHIGFVIGKNFNYSREVVSIDENGEEVGADIYSFVSVLCKGLQEQSEKIKELQEEIKDLKNERR